MSEVLYVAEKSGNLLQPVSRFSKLLLNLRGELFSRQQVRVSSHVTKPRVGRQPLEVPESLSGDINTTSFDMLLLQNVHLVHPSSQTYS